MTTPPGDGPPSSEQPSDSEPTQPLYGQPGHDQPPAGQPTYPPAAYAPAAYPPAGYGYAPPDHPRATTSLVLGILGLVGCQVLSPFAWSIGKKAVAEIDASQGRLGGRSQAQAGYILGIVGSVLLILAAGFLVVWLLVALIAIGGAATNS